MWSRFCKLITALLLAELALIEPPLLEAGGYDQGQQTGQALLNQFQAPTTLQQKLQTVPNYSDTARDHQVGNPYYTQDPANRSTITQYQQDTVNALNAPQGVTGQATTTLRNRATSPWSWTFGTSSSVLKQMQSRIPPGASIQQGCQPQQYCAVPSTATSVTQTCTMTQTLQTATCIDQDTLQTQPDGTQIDVRQDGCTLYESPPWWSLQSTCQDSPGTTNCHTYLTNIEQSSKLCVDHYLYARIIQIGNLIHLQVQDQSEGGVPHMDCEPDHSDWWHDLGSWATDLFPSTPSFSISMSGEGCDTKQATITGIGSSVLLGTCPGSDPDAQWPTLTWTAPILNTTCHACWTTEHTYANTITSSNDCQALEHQGCTISGQQCLNQGCTQLTRTYTCPGPTDQAACNQWKDYLLCSTCVPDPPGPPKCTDISYPANGDFTSTATAMEGNATLSRDREAAAQIFPGDQSWCTQNPINDCCAEGGDAAGSLKAAISMIGHTLTATEFAIGGYYLYTDFEYFQLVAQNSGIFTAALNLNDVIGDFITSVIQDALTEALGASMADFIIAYVDPALMAIQGLWMIIQMLTACSAASLETATKVDLTLCHEVGDWCNIDLLFFCAETIVGYCCFHTILARIIQEQGRDQLGLDWGDPQNPACGGLSVDQLSRIDFSRIDLSEYIADLQNRMRWPDSTDTASRQSTTSALPLTDSIEHTIANYGSLGARVQNAIATPPPPPSTLTLSLLINGSGTIAASPGGSCSASCSLAIPPHTPITLTATPAAGWRFLSWSNACSGAGPCTVTLTTPTTVTAIFDTTQTTLTVIVGAGGTVVSSPPGLTCTNATCTHLFDPGTTVTLTATPTDATWLFAGWNGDCSGTGSCILTLNMPHQAGAVFYQTTQIVTFSADTTFPAPAGVPITWTTTTIHGTPPIQYQYAREDNGSNAVVQDWSPTSQYRWATNALSAGTHRLQVLVRSAGSTAPYEDWRITDPFTIVSPLQVTGITPHSGARHTIVTVTISGQSFRTGDAVTLSGNGIIVSGVSVFSDSQIQATLTIDIAAATGPRDLTITDPAGVSATLPGALTIQ